jgi:hypothetical protein
MLRARVQAQWVLGSSASDLARRAWLVDVIESNRGLALLRDEPARRLRELRTRAEHYRPNLSY